MTDRDRHSYVVTYFPDLTYTAAKNEIKVFPLLSIWNRDDFVILSHLFRDLMAGIKKGGKRIFF